MEMETIKFKDITNTDLYKQCLAQTHIVFPAAVLCQYGVHFHDIYPDAILLVLISWDINKLN